MLPASRERIRRKLATAEDGDRQMVDILAAVPSDGLPAVEAACAEAVREGVHSAGVVINILARRRDPAAPVTILTPEALRLQHEPAARSEEHTSELQSLMRISYAVFCLKKKKQTQKNNKKQRESQKN